MPNPQQAAESEVRRKAGFARMELAYQEFGRATLALRRLPFDKECQRKQQIAYRELTSAQWDIETGIWLGEDD
jgi:hypothetical protein